MLTTIGRLYTGLINGLAALAALMIVFAIGLVILNVASRALGQGAIQSSIAIVEYILLYFTLLSAPYLLNTRGHVMVDMVVSGLVGLPRRLLEAAIYLVGIAVSVVFAVVSIQIMGEAIQRGYFDERSIDIPYWLLYAAFPLCFGLLAIEFGRYLVTSRSLFNLEQREGL